MSDKHEEKELNDFPSLDDEVESDNNKKESEEDNSIHNSLDAEIESSDNTVEEEETDTLNNETTVEEIEEDEVSEFLSDDEKKAEKTPVIKYGIPILGIIAVGTFGYVAYDKFIASPTPNVAINNNYTPPASTGNQNNTSVIDQTGTETSNEVNTQAQNSNQNSGMAIKERQPENFGSNSASQELSGNQNTIGSISNSGTQDANFNNNGMNTSVLDVQEERDNISSNMSNSQYEEIMSRLDNLEEMIEENRQSIQENERINQRLDAVISRVDNMNATISNMQNDIKSMSDAMSIVNEIAEEKQEEQMENEGNVRLNVPAFAEGRERMVGYKVVSSAKDPSMVIVENNKGDMVVFAPDTSVSYKGQSLFVENVNNTGSIVLVGDKYFVDNIKGEGPKSTKKVEEKTTEKKVVKKSSSKPRFIPKSERPAIPGWKGIAKMDNGQKIGIDLGDGRFITLVEDEPVKRYGRVQEITSDGTVYFRTHKIEFTR